MPAVSLRVLLVEDEPVLSALFGEVLEGLGFVVCAIAVTELDAVAAAVRCKPDLMLVDVQLCVGNGISAVAAILSAGFVPHVFYSADISRVLALQPSAIALQKPFRIGELAQAINRALSASPHAPTGCSI